MAVTGIHLLPVLQAEQAPGVEPRPVGFFAGRVVLVRMPEGALALQVVLGRRHLADGGYHRGRFQDRWTSGFMAVVVWLAKLVAGSLLGAVATA